MKDKWWAIFWMVLVMTVGSCSAYENHNITEYRIAQLECQQSNNNER